MAEEDFEIWSDLAGTDEERRQVQQVRDSFDTLVRDAEEVFTLIEDGSEEEASELLEGRLEDEGFDRSSWPPRKR